MCGVAEIPHGHPSDDKRRLVRARGFRFGGSGRGDFTRLGSLFVATDHVSAEVKVRFEGLVTDGALDVCGVMDELHVLSEVGEVAVDAAALLARSWVQRVKLTVTACNNQNG